jgi:murein DD-endopeptidase MepM/ murein hydrolase activator NlpD
VAVQFSGKWRVIQSMKPIFSIVFPVLLLPVLLHAVEHSDMLTPAYYQDGALRSAVDAFIGACRTEPFHHPLESGTGGIPEYRVPGMGRFGAGKGPTGTEQHHPATDLHVGNRETQVELFAAHDGLVSTVRDAPKYRHYIAITKPIMDEAGKELGKLVTLYGHVDLDLDEAAGLSMDGKQVKAGDLISKNLYAGTRGGPHLHFEIRYYRPADSGNEEFYGFRESVPSEGTWPYGFWNPEHGYGYANPINHGLTFP